MKLAHFIPRFSLNAPRNRLIYAFVASLMISAIHRIDGLLALNFVFIALASYQYRTDFKPYFRRWLKLHSFTLLLWLTLSWQLSPQGLAFSAQGIQLAVQISLRFNLIMLILWLCCARLNQSQLIQGIRQLPLPNKLIYLFIFSIRYIQVFQTLNQNMERAMRARGFQAKCNSRTFYVSAQRVALLLIHALLKTKKTQMALQARAFHINQPKVEKDE